ncbi:hypothetical protein [Paraburkholderia sp. BL9I2N2]|uniref:hypothetical protein n=1 Tax=Paraburkholderia sp. BL9I2N2 TaxID=1938809 RepID=UPI0010532287|nr:hypothetical protein [Paraburkholderia sp. BL9I2N2]
MDFVDPVMSLLDYVGMVNQALAVWKDELKKQRPRRSEFSAAIRNAMFTENDAGWQRYAAHMAKELEWFSTGKP